MIQKLAALYKYIPDEMFEENEFGLCLDNRTEDVIVLGFILEDNKIMFSDISLEQYSKNKNITHFYYKSSSANTVSDFPTIITNHSDIKNEKSFKKIKRILQNCSKINNNLSLILDYFDNNTDFIKEKILDSVNQKNNYILTISINNKYVGNSDYFKKIRESAATTLLSPYYSFNKKEIRVMNKTCSVCMQSDIEVWGYVSTFNFYAVKTEFPPIAGGMSQEETWKNYPVCPECAVKLQKSKRVLINQMRYNLCGFSYFIIPGFIEDRKNDVNDEIIEVFLDENYEGKFKIDNKSKNKITSAEREIFEILSDIPNQITYNLFFFEENNSEFKILLSIDDIYPHHLKSIFNSKQKIEKFNIFHNLKGLYNKSINSDMEFNFDILKTFFPIKSKIFGDFSKSFLEITRSIFLQKMISKGFVLRQIMNILSKKFANDEFIQYDTLKSFMLILFLENLGCIKRDNKTIMKEIYMDDIYKSFFAEHQDFFNSSIKKAIFLEGVLCQHLLDIQRVERGACPFRSRLNGMKLNQRIVEKLLPEMIEKLNQYNKNYYRKLEETISELFINSKFDLSNDEISYYFILGMNLNRKFKAKEEIENDNQ